LQPAMGQEIQWRYDYPTARREAAEKDRPMLIDFGTENCYWCKQLDARTFRDPAVAGGLNDPFVALQLDAQREPDLVSKLRVPNYPTLVIAAPDGKILGTFEGFMEAPKLQEQLQRVLAGGSTPDWMARDCEEAGRALAASEYARAVNLLRKIMEDRQD